jgi:hypothetical protein
MLDVIPNLHPGSKVWPAGRRFNGFRLFTIIQRSIDGHFNRPARRATHRMNPAENGKRPPALEWMVETQCTMKQYVIDELRPEDHHKVKQYLDEHYGPVEMGGIYWIQLAAEKLTEIQQQHADCQPFYVAVELRKDQLALELLVRTKRRVRCACIGYAAGNQRTWMMDLVDTLFKRLDILT